MSGGNPALGRFVLKVAGMPVPDDLGDSIISLRAEQSLVAPDVLELMVQDDQFEPRNISQVFRLGGDLTVRYESGWAPNLGADIFKGDITTVESTYDHVGSVVVVRAYDATHRLMHGRQTVAYENMAYDAIVRKVAQRRAVTIGQIDAVPVIHEHITQADVDDWTFLESLAEDCGMDLFVRDGKLHFSKVKPLAGIARPGDVDREDPLHITRGDSSLLTLRASVTAGEQISKVDVRGWSTKTKREVHGISPVRSVAAAPHTTLPALVAAAKANAVVYSTGRPSIDTQALARSVSEAAAYEIGGAATSVTAELVGDPRLKAGAVVSITEFDAAVNGLYRLTTVTHTWHPDLGYQTAFEVTDRRPSSILGLTGSSQSNEDTALCGIVPAIVTDNKDPQGSYRVRVRFPWLDPTYVSAWARLVQPGAGGQRGTVMIPEVNDEVLVAFEEGDRNRPYVLGGLYNSVDKPPVPGAQVAANGRVLQRAFHSRTGHSLTFHDGDSAPNQSIEIVSSDKKVTVTLAGSAGVQIAVQDQRKVSVTTNGPLELAGATVKVTAKGSLEMSGATVKIDATGPATYTGKPIKLN